jgi:pimeloyl-ACP methyl ester carboxylesterase
VIELAPFTRKQSVSVGDLLRVKRHRAGSVQLGLTMALGSLRAWKKYLDLAYPTKPADWADELGRIGASLSEPARMKVLQAMTRSAPTDAGAQLPNVTCPVLVVEGSLDPDWADPRAEGEKIVADLPTGLGELAVIDGAGHYPHAQTPDAVLAVTLPFLDRTLARA